MSVPFVGLGPYAKRIKKTSPDKPIATFFCTIHPVLSRDQSRENWEKWSRIANLRALVITVFYSVITP